MMNRMIGKLVSLLLTSLCFSPFAVHAASVVLHSRDAVAWLPEQTMRGSVYGIRAKTIVIHLDNETFAVAVNEGVFRFSFVLHEGVNAVWAESREGGKRIVSGTVRLTLGYHPEPLLIPYAEVKEHTIVLHTKMVMNPWQTLRYHWTEDERNPARAAIRNADDSVASIVMPKEEGTYYFNVMVTSGKDTARFETFVMKKANLVQAFDMNTMHAPWIDSAVIYEISPHAFVANPTYGDITAKLPEIKSLGVNTIWLQPLMQNLDKSQGYEVTDYFSLRDDLGTESQLQRLIDTAKRLGLRVLFDFVPNHTSIHHAYAEEAAKYKDASHYYNFYQHKDDGAMYSSHYHKDSSGFVYYFWDDLVNLNYINKEVQQWMIEACTYWVKKYDIDGYRFDAVWGVNARQPDFGKRLQTALKAIKPDLFFLAEDKEFGGALTKGFDAVYDWTADTGWVSQWSWQYEYHPEKTLTVFNHPSKKKRDSLMHNAMFGDDASGGLRLRFLENNDLPRFVSNHSLEQTKTAAILTFVLPGIPMIYDGQEAGIKTFPRKKKPTFLADQSIQSLDSNGLFPFYQKVIALRASHSCLLNGKMEEITTASPSVIAFRRWNEMETIVTIINMDSVAIVASLDVRSLLNKTWNTLVLTDLFTGEQIMYPMQDAAKANISLIGSGARVFLLSGKE